jgi:hypothetical protein
MDPLDQNERLWGRVLNPPNGVKFILAASREAPAQINPYFLRFSSSVLRLMPSDSAA